MSKSTTIGRIIGPTQNYDLESSLRVHRLLVQRALQPRWRFKGTWVTTGPYETMIGYPSCGSIPSQTSLSLTAATPLGDSVTRVNQGILRAMCDYSGFAELSEPIPERPFVHCSAAWFRLAAFTGRKTARRLNQCHARARVIHSVGLECGDSGVHFKASVGFNLKPCDSCWSVFHLLRRNPPRWNERLRLATWLEQCADLLDAIIQQET